MGGVRLEDVALQVGRRLRRHAAYGADPFLARRRTDYYLVAEYQDALGHQAVLPWTRDGVAVRHLAPHLYGRRAPLGRGLAARLAAEPASAAAELAAHLLVPLAPLLA